MRKYCSKVIVENFFEPCILFLLSVKPSYGYDLNQQLLENCGCNVNVGNLYRCLSRLTKGGYITKKKIPGTKGPDRVEYAITGEGHVHLKAWISELENETETINKLITNYKNIYENHNNT
jgi:PadR family transcriptional regulator PadR